VTDRTSNDLEEPDEIRAPDGQRRDGRPSDGTVDHPKPADQGEAHPTVAPEEKGGSPSTEHAPGADL
jgi:hypothetical protein